MEYLLSTSCLTKQFKKQKAVNQVSLHIRQGEIYGFIGRNGAGKTTFMKMICGLSEPTAGEIALFGKSGSEFRTMLHRIGALIETPGLYPGMTAYDNMKLKCICAGISKKGYIEELLRLVGLQDAEKKCVRNFSMGMKQRLGIAIALVGEPDLLILDEPTNGLDPQGIAEVRETILKLNREKKITFMISSHILEELSKIATSYGIIHAGHLLQELSREELMEKCSERIEIKLDSPEKACVILDSMRFSNYTVIDANTIYIYERLDEVSDINLAFAKNGLKIASIGVNSEALEDYFINLTGGAVNA
ncbi:MAG: ABC transporter ATP-binding protein [Oscillospiraceae bacterium]